jgi:uncharacterized protein (DUF2132 family)
MWFEKKYFFGWGNLKRGITELIKTFSSKPSLFSSKKIERGLLFASALIMVIVYFSYHMKLMHSGDMLLITGALFVYAGYTMNMTRKDKLDERKDENI